MVKPRSMPDQRGVAAGAAGRRSRGTCRPRRPSSGASASIRSRISPAALLVKVMARMFSAGDPRPSRWATRRVMTRVLPDPRPPGPERPVDVGDGLALGRRQIGEQVHGVGFILRRLVWSECSSISARTAHREK